MLRRFSIISFCLILGLSLTSMAFSQDDPSTTDPDKIENAPDESKSTLQDDSKAEEPSSAESYSGTTGETTIAAADAMTYSDGKTIFVNSKVHFKLTSTDDLQMDRIEYKVDEGGVATYQDPFSIAEEGYHTIKYYGIDRVGNKEAEKAYNVAVDNTGPTMVITTSSPVKKIGDKIYYQKNVQFSISSNDALSGVKKVEYTTDGSSFQEYVAPFGMPSTATVNLKARGIDNVGNVTELFSFRVLDESGQEIELKDSIVNLVVDEVAPTVAIQPDKEMQTINNQNVATIDTKYTITAQDADSGVSTILYRLDGQGDFIPYAKEIEFKNNGRHQIDARAIDKAGNISGITTLTVYVDIIPPNSLIETVEK